LRITDRSICGAEWRRTLGLRNLAVRNVSEGRCTQIEGDVLNQWAESLAARQLGIAVNVIIRLADRIPGLERADPVHLPAPDQMRRDSAMEPALSGTDRELVKTADHEPMRRVKEVQQDIRRSMVVSVAQVCKEAPRPARAENVILKYVGKTNDRAGQKGCP